MVLPLTQMIDDPTVGVPIRLGNSIDFFTARISHKLDLTGPSFTVMAACATSLLAIHLATRSLREGECEVAVAGGATIDVPLIRGYLAGVEGILSTTGHIRPFDAGTDGTIFGSGAGVVVLRPLDDALAEGNPVYAVIRGSAATNDGNPPGKESFIAPSPEGRVSAFGFGGSNVHVILEEYKQALPVASSRRSHLLLFSAQSELALNRRIGDLGVHLDQNAMPPIASLAHTLQCGKIALAQRACFYAHEETFSPGGLLTEKPSATGRVKSENRPALFLFPGQGSQYPGMGQGVYAVEPLYRSIIDECAEELLSELGLDIRTLLHADITPAMSSGYSDDAALLRNTANAQPALFVVEYAMARLFMSWGVKPAAMLGHSIGELVAACIAGVFSRAAALRIVAARARLMQACEPGAMAAVFMAEQELKQLLPDRLELAAINAPAISVVSGRATTWDALLRNWRQVVSVADICRLPMLFIHG